MIVKTKVLDVQNIFYERYFKYYDNLMKNMDLIFKVLKVNYSDVAKTIGMTKQNFSEIKRRCIMTSQCLITIMEFINCYEKSEDQIKMLDMILYNPEKYGSEELELFKKIFENRRSL